MSFKDRVRGYVHAVVNAVFDHPFVTSFGALGVALYFFVL